MRPCPHLVIIGAQLSGMPRGTGVAAGKARLQVRLDQEVPAPPRIPDAEDQRPYQQAGE
jgi:hypothetical protein